MGGPPRKWRVGRRRWVADAVEIADKALTAAVALHDERKAELDAVEAGNRALRTRLSEGDDTVSTQDLLSGTLAIQRATALLEHAGRVVDEAKAAHSRALAAADPGVSQIVAEFLAEALAPLLPHGIPTVVVSSLPEDLPEVASTPLAYIIQTKASERDVNNGTVAGVAEAHIYTPAGFTFGIKARELLRDGLRSSAHVGGGSEITSAGGGADEAIGGGLTRSGFRFHIKAGRERLPVLDAGPVQPHNVTALGSTFAILTSDAVRVKVVEARFTSSRDGDRVTRVVTLDLLARSSSLTVTEISGAVRTVAERVLPGIFAPGLGRVVSAEVKAAPQSGGARAVDAAVTVTLESRAADSLAA